MVVSHLGVVWPDSRMVHVSIHPARMLRVDRWKVGWPRVVGW